MFDLVYFKGINGTQAIPIALKAWLDLIQNGYSGNYLPLDDSINEAFVIFIKDKAVAISIFQKQENDTYLLDTTWIEPFYRGRKLYTVLWNKLKDHSKLNNIKRIISYTDIHNDIMRSIAKTQNRTEKEVNLDGEDVIELTFYIE